MVESQSIAEPFQPTTCNIFLEVQGGAVNFVAKTAKLNVSGSVGVLNTLASQPKVEKLSG